MRQLLNKLLDYDDLKIVQFFGSLASTKPIKSLFIITFAFHIVMEIINIYFFLTVRSTRFFSAYVTGFIAFLYASCAILLYLAGHNANLSKSLSLWWPKTVQRKNEFRRTSIYLNIRTTYEIIVLAITINFFLIPQENDKNTFFALFFFHKYLSEWELYLTLVYKVAFIVTSYSIVFNYYQTLYTMNIYGNQFDILVDYIDEINSSQKDFHIEEQALGYNQSYQYKVEKRLKSVARRYVEIKHGLQDKNYSYRLIMLVHSTLGFLFTIGAVIYAFKVEGAVNHMLGRVIAMALLSVNVATGYFASGQLVEDKFTSMCDKLNTLNWYNFNTKNRKLFLNFLLYTGNPFKIPFFGKWSLNYDLGLSVLKLFYTYASIVVQYRTKWRRIALIDECDIS